MKIKIEKLSFSKKVYEVKQTVKNMRLTYQLEMVLANTSDLSNKDNLEVLSGLNDALDQCLNYIHDTLKLSDEQMEKVEDSLEQNDVFDIANLIAMKLMGIKETDIPSKEEQKSNKSTD